MASHPPSTDMIAPLIHAAAGDPRKHAIAAISAGRPNRRSVGTRQQRRAVDDPLLHQRLQHIGLHVARRDRVHPHAERPPLAGQRADQVRHRAFRCGVSGAVGPRGHAIDRAGRQYHPSPRRHHPPRRSLSGQKYASQVQVQHPAPFRLGQLQRRLVGRHPGVGMRHVDAAPGAVHRGKRGLDIRATDRRTLPTDPARRRVRHRIEIQHANPPATRRIPIRDRAPDPARPPGHQQPRPRQRVGGQHERFQHGRTSLDDSRDRGMAGHDCPSSGGTPRCKCRKPCRTSK